MRVINTKGNHKLPANTSVTSLLVGFLAGVVVVTLLCDWNPVDSYALLEGSAHSNQLACIRDSGGFFNDISDRDWSRMKERVKTRQNHFHIEDPTVNIDFPAGWYQENFEPDFTCLHERRVGGMGDGPKWVCDPHRLTQKKDCLIYSVGSEGNFRFEKSVRKEIGKHCEIHTFDPEIQGRAYGNLAPEGVHYHNWGLKSESLEDRQSGYHWDSIEFHPTFKSMKEILETLGHVGREIDIFKIDCEGCEWTTYPDWFKSGAIIRQILVEVHMAPEDNDFFTDMQENGYVTFHKEPNIQYAQGSCVEYAFLKLEESFFKEG